MSEKEFSIEQFHLDLLQKRVIYLDGNITSEVAKQFGKAIVWVNAQDDKRPITLYLDSPGGNADAGLDMCDMIRHSRAPVTGIVYRQASSMAAVILQTCTTRKCMSNAGILLHSIRLNEVPLDQLEDDLEKAIEKTRKIQAAVNKVVQSRTGFSNEKMREINKKDQFFSPDQALELGLIDEILDEK